MPDRPAHYRIIVRGRVAPTMSDRLGGLQILPSALENGTPTTTLIGRLQDQAALTEVLNTLYELHLPVLSVNQEDRTESIR
jgi:hypothetical protein